MEQGIYGRYQLRKKIAAGGMGEVYAAVHEIMQREAVIKILLPELSDNAVVVRRFFREAQAAAQLQHPGIVKVFDFGYTDDGRAYIVMEMLRGETLGQRLDRTPVLPLDQSVRIIRQLAGAVGAAHAQGIVHRDLKPDNIFLVPDPEVQGGERVKVLDFGLAKLAMYAGTSMATLRGSIFGTPAYMAPEQCTDSAAVDHRADLYSIGCILYRCLCGRTPFGTGVEALLAHRGAPVIAPRERKPNISRHIESVILALLRKHPGERPSSCQALIDALDRKPSTAATLRDSGAPVNAPVAPADTDKIPANAGPALHAAPTMMLNVLSDDDVIGPLPEIEGDHATTTSRRRSSLTIAGAGEMLAPSPLPARAQRGWHPATTAVLGALALSTLAAALVPLVWPRETAPDEAPIARFDAYQTHAEQALEARQWSEAFLVLEQALALGIADPVRIRRAVQTQEEARREQQSQEAFARFLEALAEDDLDAIRRHYAAIPRDSAYHLEAELDYRARRGDHFEHVRAEAAALIERGACTDLNARINEAEQAFPGALAELADLATRCTTPNRARASRTAPGDSPSDRLRAIKIATRQSQYHEVMRLCAQGLRNVPEPTEAATLCAMAACRTGRERRVWQHHRTLPPERQSDVVQTCLEHGITLRDPRP